MNHRSRHAGPFPAPTVVHHVICQHQVEIEVWPAQAEVYFQDERFVSASNTQVRFEAAVYNAPIDSVLWEVKGIDGGPGAGAIDPTGLYVAPPKGSTTHGTTDVIIATPVADRVRKAYAYVTLVGFGPQPAAQPRIDIFPKQTYIYYPRDQTPADHNDFIDESNKRQFFRAIIRNSDSNQTKWYVNSGGGWIEQIGWNDPWYLYAATGYGSDGRIVKVKVQLKDDPNTVDEAQIVLINYHWPGIVNGISPYTPY